MENQVIETTDGLGKITFTKDGRKIFVPKGLDYHHLYLIRAGDTERIKIGMTSSCPFKRLKQLQTGNPEQLYFIQIWTSISKEVIEMAEKTMHNRMDAGHIHGDWFVPMIDEYDIREEIAEIITKTEEYFFSVLPKYKGCLPMKYKP